MRWREKQRILIFDVAAIGKAYQKHSLKIKRDDLPQLASQKVQIIHLYSDIHYWSKEQAHTELCDMFNVQTALSPQTS